MKFLGDVGWEPRRIANRRSWVKTRGWQRQERIVYDAERNTITLKQLPNELVQQLREQGLCNA